MEPLEKAVKTVVHQCLGVKAGEQVLVICNPDTHKLAVAFRREAESEGADAMMVIMAERRSNGEEPPRAIAAAMEAADVVLAPTVQSLSHTEARRAANDAGTRIATLPGVTEEMLARVMSCDMHKLVNRTLALTEVLTVGSEVRVTTEKGTDLTLSVDGRSAIADTGELSAPGMFGNIPCGESYIAPIEGSASGTIVIDGTVATFGRVKEPITLKVADGHLEQAEGDFGPSFLDALNSHGRHGTNVAELGIGTNEMAQLTGNVLEDEKVLGSVHVAFGASAAIGGKVQVPIHLDCVILEPTVEVDGHTLMQAGKARI